MPGLLDVLADELAAASPEQLAELAEVLAPLLAPYLGPAGGLLTVAEFAARVGMNPDVVTRCAREGRIPGARKVGREWRFDADRLQVLPVDRQPPALPGPLTLVARGRPAPDRAAASLRRCT